MAKNSIREDHELHQQGLLRIKQVLRYVPVSRSNWWAGVRIGRYPKPLKLSERVTVWRAADIRQLVEQGSHDPKRRTTSALDKQKRADR